MHSVAARAGVSQMTVSRVMRGTGYISAEVRDRVMQAAADIGYVHNRLAGGASDYENPLVAVVLPTLQNRVFTEVMTGLSSALDTHGIRPVFGVTEYAPEEEERVARDLLSWRPQGLILTGLEHTDALRELIDRTGVRTIEIMDTDGEPLQSSIGISHRKAGRAMARHLLSRGHRKFALAASLDGRDVRAGKRFEAFASVVLEAGGQIIERPLSGGASSMQLGYRMTQDLLGAQSSIDAVYFSNDDLAAGGLLYCMANGLSIPKDLALAGFNGLDFLEAFPQRLTTTVTPREQIGAAAGAAIASYLPAGATEPQKFELDLELVPGNTS
ncbi:MAG: LacI family DNA-binding transcriptional regulator [Pseudomonadota bacterium]